MTNKQYRIAGFIATFIGVMITSSVTKGNFAAFIGIITAFSVGGAFRQAGEE